MENYIFYGIGILLGLFVLYRIFFRKKDSSADEYIKLYEKILNSEEYKPKSQWEK